MSEFPPIIFMRIYAITIKMKDFTNDACNRHLKVNAVPFVSLLVHLLILHYLGDVKTPYRVWNIHEQFVVFCHSMACICALYAYFETQEHPGPSERAGAM